MKLVGILVVFIKNDDAKTGLNWFQIILEDEPGENFYLGDPSSSGSCKIHVFPHKMGLDLLHTYI